MKKFLIAAIVVVALGLLAFFVAKSGKKSDSNNGGLTLENGILSIGMEIGYPPFEYFDTDGKTPIGFDVEMAKALAAKLNLEPRFIDTAWDGIFAGVATGRYDCVISAATITEERKAAYNFTKPYIGNAQAIVLRKDSPFKLQSPQDLTGLRVTYQAETTSDIYVTKLVDEGLNIKLFEYDKVMNCFDELKLDRVDAIVCDSLVAVDYVSPADSPFVIVWQGPSDEQFGICLKKGNDALTSALNNALDELFNDGAMQALSQKIFKMDMVSGVRN
jgi:polar amino acid transport system substrate-binding protein